MFWNKTKFDIIIRIIIFSFFFFVRNFLKTTSFIFFKVKITILKMCNLSSSRFFSYLKLMNSLLNRVRT